MVAARDDKAILRHVAAQMAQPEEFLGRVRQLEQHPDSHVEDLLTLADGRLVERFVQPLKIGQVAVGVLISFRDVTARMRLEEEVRLRLEERVRERTRSLEEANCELQAINAELELRRQEAEETNNRLRQLSGAVENSSTAIVIADAQGCIEYVNPKFTDVTGYTAQEAIGRNPRFLQAEGRPGRPTGSSGRPSPRGAPGAGTCATAGKPAKPSGSMPPSPPSGTRRGASRATWR